jgi:hypothetical protein
MSPLDQLLIRAVWDARGTVEPVGSSFPDGADSDQWLQALAPWLRAGGPPGRCYLNFGAQAALIRWRPGRNPGRSWEFADVLIGPAATLSDGEALQLPEPPAGRVKIPRRGRLPNIEDIDLIKEPGPAVVTTMARSAPALELLVPLLTRILAGKDQVMMPWTGPHAPEAALFGLVNVLAMLRDERPLSFITCASGSFPAPSGLFVTFYPQAAALPPDPVYWQVAHRLATCYADEGLSGLNRMLDQHGILKPTDRATRIALMLELWPGPRPPAPAAGIPRQAAGIPRPAPGNPPPTARNDDGTAAAKSASAKPAKPANQVICPICLSNLDWSDLPLWRWDGARSEYAPIEVPAGANRQQRARLQRGALVRCPDPNKIMPDEHYLPADYGRFGAPVILGFIGLTKSGKSHLLTAMIGEIERGGLERYGIRNRPIDQAIHKAFLDTRVHPLLRENKVLPPTKEDVISFADAFILAPANGPERPVALFDVAGGNLTRVNDTQQFLEIADGLIFVVDPAQLHPDGLGDDSFNIVLNLLKSSDRLPDEVSAAIVLNKADLLRFEDPIDLWLRSDRDELDAEEIVRESADVFAYLDSKHAQAWTRPYHECARATLHVASATGGAGPPEGQGGVYPRGVTPRRVLEPLLALLAMTGVLTGVQAEEVGI